MESLLCLAFDNISTRETPKIRKGLRQIEGLLAQLCLVRPSSRSPHKRKSSVLGDKAQQHGGNAAHKQLREFKADPAFREFFRLQDSFQWNIASRLVATLERLLGQPSTTQTDAMILSALDLLQGTLLLHPPSRSLFARELHMNLLLDLLDAANPPHIQAQALLALVAALLDRPRNTRAFERADGLLCITSLFKARATAKDVKMRSLEFLYFYLMPEAPLLAAAASAPSTAVGGRGSDGLEDAFARRARTYSEDGEGAGSDVDMDAAEETRTMDEKQVLLSRHLNNVAELVADIQEGSPFGAQVV